MSRSSRTVNRHHTFWPRRAYTTSAEREFRNLSCNVVLMEVEAHHRLHRTTKPPAKPKQSIMLQAIHLHRRGHCPTCHGALRATG